MLEGKKIGIGITGSFCSFHSFILFLKELLQYNIDVELFVSEEVLNFDTRFYKAKDFINKIENMTGKKVISTIVETEPFGPIKPLDAMIVYPCSSNTLAKLTHGINDNAITMAVKSTLRSNHPIIIGICSNDALSTSGKNMMELYNRKNFYLVPMIQDNIYKKPNSLIASHDYIIQTLKEALSGRQIQPLFHEISKK